MAINPRNPDWERQDAVLRSLKLNAVIPALWPEAQGPHSDGSGVMQWQWPDGLKVNVLRDETGFVAWDHRDGGGRVNSRGPSKGMYAAMLVQAIEGGRFPDAIRRLKAAGMLDGRFVVQQPKPQTQGEKKREFVWRYDYSRPFRPVRDYLVEQRGIPESVVKTAWAQRQVEVGFGPTQRHYILFPCRDWSMTAPIAQGPAPTGALKRWMESYPPDNPAYMKMAMTGTDKKAGWWQFALGNVPKDIVILTEQPIDALSVMAAAQMLGRDNDIAVVGFGGQGGVTEKLVGMGAHVVIATDHDAAGLGYANEIERMVGTRREGQTMARCLPPPEMDWNEWWQADPQAASHALGNTLHQVRGKQPNPFERIHDSALER
ncbi:hypothetical protein BXT84_00620 [Sulfobacillus thermotolerans]|uniref:Toprim domain-containing protein n=1 Tax=Sulfobacillus thermotolerans TaxID=338644 RepID=A0ABN5GWY9_9FIRM|nr:hypothetical protein BXT84_00620 [Sulfobacillus thermotolerans]